MKVSLTVSPSDAGCGQSTSASTGIGLGSLSAWQLGSKSKSLKNNQVEAELPFVTQLQKSHNVSSAAQVREGRAYRLPLNVTSVKVHCEKSLRTGVYCGGHLRIHDMPQRRKEASHG